MCFHSGLTVDENYIRIGVYAQHPFSKRVVYQLQFNVISLANVICNYLTVSIKRCRQISLIKALLIRGYWIVYSNSEVDKSFYSMISSTIQKKCYECHDGSYAIQEKYFDSKHIEIN